MNDENRKKLKNIKRQICNYSDLLYERGVINRSRYKCENWEEFNNNNIEEKLMNQAVQVVNCMNEFINYPKTKFLFINTTKKVKIYKRKDFVSGMIMIDIPFIDKREYFCLINLLDDLDVLAEWSKGTYWFK